YLPSGVSKLQVLAVSNSVPAVQYVAFANVNVVAGKGVKATISPSPASTGGLGAANMLLKAVNTGNVSDSYTAAITGTTGGITATLVSPNGQSGQSIPHFSLSALNAAQFPLNATASGNSGGSVTVKVTSLSDSTISSTVTVPISLLPNLISAPTSLQFSGVAGTPITTPQTLTITSNGAALDFAVTTDQPWLHASPASGNTSGTNTINVTVDTTGLAASQTPYQGNVKLTSAGAGNSPLSVPVSLTLGSQTPVTVGTSPTGLQFSVNNTTYTSTQNLMFAPGTQITVNVPSPQNVGNSVLAFLSWSDNRPQSHTVTVGTTPLNLIATFAAPGTLTLNHYLLNYGYSSNLITNAQPILVSFQGGAPVPWTASSNSSNITVSPASGTGNGTFSVTATPGASGVVTVTSPLSLGSPKTLNINIKSVTPAKPFGSFDTPIDNTTGIAGAIPVTGWVLGNIEINKVDIWREPLPGDTPSANGLVFIGDAVFVNGARPDVEAVNGDQPWYFRGGWGYMLLTNYLQSTGSANGTYKLHAIAHDVAGLSTDLGTKTITVDNLHANKPFGTIDTPDQGGQASGTQFINFGWALTQLPYTIPKNGSTITTYIDGVPVGHPTYNQLRSDIATRFPGLNNSQGAVGYFFVDTTVLINGVHTIAWVVYDDQNRGDGIGSRFFNVLNLGGVNDNVPDLLVEPADPEGMKLIRGYGRAPDLLKADDRGVHNIEIEEADRIELHAGASEAYSVIGGQLRELPPGSTLKNGVFYWQLAPGLFGDYDLLIKRPNEDQVRVRVKVKPKTFTPSNN
ncbi:MAG TPA: hypothetical protein VE961_14085, partial [Pyrinomonadaceae bacterium]|nr:hypothetical protein [Pyrinomonadaceae bacterium]